MGAVTRSSGLHLKKTAGHERALPGMSALYRAMARMNPIKPISISVVMATYNWPEALMVALSSFISQYTRDFELLVADDGSDAPIADLIRVFHHHGLPFRLRHIWHPHAGPRPG